MVLLLKAGKCVEYITGKRARTELKSNGFCKLWRGVGWLLRFGDAEGAVVEENLALASS